MYKSLDRCKNTNIVSCSFDYFKITDENHVMVSKKEYCGQQIGENVTVGGDYAVMTFHSNAFRYKQRGFIIFFTAVQPCKCNQNVA